MGGVVNGLWKATAELANAIMYPPLRPGPLTLDGWDLAHGAGDYKKLRVLARTGAFKDMRVKEDRRLELVVGMFVGRISSMADVFEHEIALLRHQVDLLSEELAVLKAAKQGHPTAATLRRKEERELHFKWLEEIPRVKEHLPTVLTRLFPARFNSPLNENPVMESVEEVEAVEETADTPAEEEQPMAATK